MKGRQFAGRLQPGRVRGRGWGRSAACDCTVAKYCPMRLVHGEGSDPIRNVASAGQHYCFRFQARAKWASEPIIVRFPRWSARVAPADHCRRMLHDSCRSACPRDRPFDCRLFLVMQAPIRCTRATDVSITRTIASRAGSQRLHDPEQDTCPSPTTASASKEAFPQPDRVVVVMFEDNSFTQIINSNHAPFIRKLGPGGSLFTRVKTQKMLVG